MVKEKSRAKCNHIMASGLVALLVFAVVYFIDGFFPFVSGTGTNCVSGTGTNCVSGSIAALDLNTQYLPLLYKFYDIVKGTGGVIVDYHIAGGINLYTEAVTELVNPFNYILLLFPRERLYLAVNLLLALYGVAASMTASYAIGRLGDECSCINVVLSVCYGLSFYNAYQFEIIRWMYLVVLFPLFLISLKELLEEQRIFKYTLLLAYQIILSLQLGFQVCMFTMCAAICYMLYLRQVEKEKRDEELLTAVQDKKVAYGGSYSIGGKCLAFVYATMAGVLIAAVNLLPAAYNILHSARSAENQSLISVITRHGLDDLLERLLEIGHPVVLGVFMGILFLRRVQIRQSADVSHGSGRFPDGGHSIRQKGVSLFENKSHRYMVLLLVLLLATVVLQPSNLLWHLGYYQCFPVRYGYMVLFLFILMAAKGNREVLQAESETGSATSGQAESVNGLMISGQAGCLEENMRVEHAAQSGKNRSIAYLAFAVAAVLCMAVFVYALANRLMFAHAFATLAISRLCIRETLLFYGMMLVFTISSAVMYVFCAKMKNNAAKHAEGTSDGVVEYTMGAPSGAADHIMCASGRAGKCVEACGKTILLALAGVAGAVMYLCVLFPQDFEARTENEAAYRAMGEAGNAPAAYSVSGHISDGESLLLNAPLVSGEYSLTAYMPAGADKGFVKAMDSLGYISPWVSVRSEGGTVISDALLGIHNSYIPAVKLYNGLLLSEEAYQIVEAAKEDTSLTIQKAILEAMCCESSMTADSVMNLWSGGKVQASGTPGNAARQENETPGNAARQENETPDNATQQENGTPGNATQRENGTPCNAAQQENETPDNATQQVGGISQVDDRWNSFDMVSPYEMQINLQQRSLVYVCTGDVNINVFVNGGLAEKEEDHQSPNPNAIHCLGEFGQGRIDITAEDVDRSPVSQERLEIAVINLDAFQAMCAELSAKNRRTVEPSGRDSQIRVYSDEPMTGELLLPLAYLKGYLTDRGQVSPYLNGLMRIQLPESTKEVTVSFSYDILKAAYAFGFLGVILLLVWQCAVPGLFLLKDRTCFCQDTKQAQKNEDESVKETASGKSTVLEEIAGKLFAVASVIFFAGVYLLPNIGMVGYMSGKLLGVDLLEKFQAGQAESAAESVLLQAKMEEDGIHVVVAGQNLVTLLGARLTADTVESGDFKAQKAGDGIVSASSRWSSENNWEDANHFLQIDLKKSQTIRALRIFWYQSNAKEYEILASNDKSFRESTVVASFWESPSEREQVVYFDSPVEARFLRLAVKEVNKKEEDLSLYYQNISIEELEIYGDDSESFVIEKPILQEGTGRVIPLPEVPDGYTLSVGGINYHNLQADEKHFADTIAAVEINLGYVLMCGDRTFDLPGFDVVLPASDGSAPEAFPYQGKAGEAGQPVVGNVLQAKADGQTQPTPGNAQQEEAASQPQGVTGNARQAEANSSITVREWKATGGMCRFSEDKIIEKVDKELLGELGEEGYRIEITEENISLIAGSTKGLCWARVTLGQMAGQAEELPCGIIRDYPSYSVRGFCIDTARRPIRMELLYEMVDELSAAKMNTLQLHLNDNAIIAESEYDQTVEGARSLYSAFRLESNVVGENGGFLTAEDLYYTKGEFKELVEYALQKGVEIVPEIDTPAHSMAITRLMPSLGFDKEPELADTLDVSKPEVLSFVEGLWGEYLQGDDSKEAVFEKCETLHLGMDEYYGKTALYEDYLVSLATRVKAMAPDKRLRVWGSLSGVGADLNKIPKDLELMIWNSYWADPETMYKAGFKIINCMNSELYIIVGGGTDRLDLAELSQSWRPNRFFDGQTEVTIPAWSDRMLGACYSMWHDHYTKGIDNTSEDDLMERFREPLGIIAGHLW